MNDRDAISYIWTAPLHFRINELYSCQTCSGPFANILEHFLSEAKKVLEDMRNSVGHFLSCDDSPDQSVRGFQEKLVKITFWLFIRSNLL